MFIFYKNFINLSVACSCGLTSGNYPEMQELYKKYEPEGLSVLAFPCNQFGGQVCNYIIFVLLNKNKLVSLLTLTHNLLAQMESKWFNFFFNRNLNLKLK